MLPRSTCPWPDHLPDYPPKHCWNLARHLPRIETRIFKTRITDVRQTKKTRSNSLDPSSSWCPWQNFLTWICLQPSPHRNLWNLQSTSSKRFIVRIFLQREWRYKPCVLNVNSSFPTQIYIFLEISKICGRTFELLQLQPLRN